MKSIRPMHGHRPTRIATIAAVAVALIALPSCGTDDGDPGATNSPTPTTTAEPEAVTSYFVGDTSRGPRLYRETHLITTEDVPTAAVAAALADPLDGDYFTPWQHLGVTVNSVTEEGGTVVVDLADLTAVHDRPAGMTADVAAMAIEQLLWTAQDAFGGDRSLPVQILNDGNHTDQVLGQPTAEALATGADIDVLAQVWITNLTEGDVLASPVHVEGLGAAFEAQIVWKVLDSSGATVDEGFTLAAECCQMEPYSFDVDLEPGTYTIVVNDTDASGGEGFAPWEDSKLITVAG
jgi:hypothetical protein